MLNKKPTCSGVVRAFASAKINLYLEVLGKRADGYHRLDSLVAFTDIGDEILIVPSDDVSLKMIGPFGNRLAQDINGDNLVLRAARALADRAGILAGAEITLIKNLPIASGIGGGSADSAATLRALPELWSIDVSPADLFTLACDLGADVPACLVSRSLRFQEIGHEITPTSPLPPCWIVLANPGVAVPTPSVFRHPDLTFSAPADFPKDFGDYDRFIAWLLNRRNDLAVPARALVPVIGEVLAQLQALTGTRLARMSGSGATCFALFGQQDTAVAGAKHLADTNPGWWVRAGRVVN